MVSIALSAVLAWLHIFSAIGWMGTAMFIVIILAPIMSKLSPQSRGELAVQLFPRVARFVIVFAILTMAFGALLVVNMTDANLSALTPANPWGLRISAGIALTIVAAGVAGGVVVPTIGRMKTLVEEMQQNPKGGPSPQLPKLQGRLRIGGSTVLILLAINLVFMVAAARF